MNHHLMVFIFHFRPNFLLQPAQSQPSQTPQSQRRSRAGHRLPQSSSTARQEAALNDDIEDLDESSLNPLRRAIELRTRWACTAPACRNHHAGEAKGWCFWPVSNTSDDHYPLTDEIVIEHLTFACSGRVGAGRRNESLICSTALFSRRGIDGACSVATKRGSS